MRGACQRRRHVRLAWVIVPTFRSCLVLTSREEPPEFTRLVGDTRVNMVRYTSWQWAPSMGDHLWQVRDWQPVDVLTGHIGSVGGIVFSPDGQQLVSVSGDETIRLWEMQTGACLTTLRSAGPYAGMNITGVTGITEAQQVALKALGAVEHDKEPALSLPKG